MAHSRTISPHLTRDSTFVPAAHSDPYIPSILLLKGTTLNTNPISLDFFLYAHNKHKSLTLWVFCSTSKLLAFLFAFYAHSL